MVSFDQVLPMLLRICETHPGFDLVEKAVAVRDLKGCIRLVVALPPGGACDVDLLEQNLVNALGPWFVPPVLGPAVSRQLSTLRGYVLGQQAPWGASWDDPATGAVNTPPDGKWHKIERHLSKIAWTQPGRSARPWPLVAQRPFIVTFYSFKGGVGRTTLLASTAWQLAEEGKRIAVVDLDVEAPGVGTLLGATTRRGVVDFVVDHYATGIADLDSAIGPATALGNASVLVDVMPAGMIETAYFEKLARLDFVGSGLTEAPGPSPVRNSLVALMQALSQRDPRPDYILIDSRAGLHDVAGLSLHDLAHVDVIVGRDSDQGYQGLELTVEALAARRAIDEIQCVVVQSLAPDDPRAPEYERITGEYRARSHGAFSRHVYSQMDEDDPELNDESAPHYPSVVRFDQRLVHFTSIDARRDELFGEDYVHVKDRIVEQCTPEEAGDG